MAGTAYPTAGNVTQLLLAAGLRSATPEDLEVYLDIDGALAAAIEDWERDTGLVPFLKDANDVTVYYDPPGKQDSKGIFGGSRGGERRLYLPSQHGSVFSSVTSVTIGYVGAGTGTVLTVDQDYFLDPRNAALNNRPYEWITFIGRQWGFLGSIVVVGKRGWPVVPDNAFKAVARHARAILAPDVGAAVHRGYLEWTEGEARIKSAADPFAGLVSADEEAYRKAVAQFRADVL